MSVIQLKQLLSISTLSCWLICPPFLLFTIKEKNEKRKLLSNYLTLWESSGSMHCKNKQVVSNNIPKHESTEVTKAEYIIYTRHHTERCTRGVTSIEGVLSGIMHLQQRFPNNTTE